MEISDNHIALIRQNPEHFTIVYQKYINEIYAYCRFLSRNKHDAEDLASFTFMKALEKFSSFHGSSTHLRSWLYTIARNIFLDKVRKGKHEQIDIEIIMKSADDVELEETRSDIKMMFEHIINHINSLEPPIYKELLILKYKQDLSMSEISNITGKSEENVRVILHRAVKKLKETLIIEK